ncbi:hypothetical protein Vretimale_11779, partial [Volvox reticuliferus]
RYLSGVPRMMAGTPLEQVYSGLLRKREDASMNQNSQDKQEQQQNGRRTHGHLAPSPPLSEQQFQHVQKEANGRALRAGPQVQPKQEDPDPDLVPNPNHDQGTKGESSNSSLVPMMPRELGTAAMAQEYEDAAAERAEEEGGSDCVLHSGRATEMQQNQRMGLAAHGVLRMVRTMDMILPEPYKTERAAEAQKRQSHPRNQQQQDRHGALGPGALAGLSGMHEARLPAGLSPNDGDRKRQLSAASGAAVTVMTAPTQDPWTPPPQPSPPLQQTCRSSFDVDSATIIISPEEILDGVSLAAIAPTDVVGRCASVGVIGAEILPSSDILVSTVQQPSLDCSESGLQLSMATNAGSLFSTSTISPGSLDDPCDASIFLPTDDVMGICSGGSAPNPCRSNCNDTVTSAATSAATNAAGVATTTTAANGLGDDRPPGNITGSVGR